MQQPDDVVHDGDHRLLACLAEAVGHTDGDLFVLAQDHFGHDVAAVVDQRVVQAAVACAWIQRGERDLELLEQIDDDIGPVASSMCRPGGRHPTAQVGLGFQLWKRCSMRDKMYVSRTPVVATITSPTKTLEV